MAKLSDILAKATAKLKGVGASVADAIAPATPSILAKDAPTSSNIGGSGVSLFEAKPGQKVDTIVDSATKGLYNIGSNFAEAEEKYLSAPEETKTIVDKSLYALAKTPFNIGAGVEQAVTAPTKTQKLEGVTNAALGVAGLMPAVSGFGVLRENLLTQDQQRGIQSGIDTIMSYSDPVLKSMGVTDENLQSTKNILFNIGNLALQTKVAPSVGGKVSGAVKKAGGGKAAQASTGFIANATVQSAPDIIGQITNYLANGGTEEDAVQTLAPTILNTLGAIPLGKKIKQSEQQTSLDITPPKGMDITDAEAVKTETPKSIRTKVVKTSDTAGQIKAKEGVLDYELVDGRMEIDGVQVNDTARRTGLGTKLMKDAEKQAKKEGVNIIRLVAIPLDKNTTYEALDSFYTKLGYEKQPDFEHVYQKVLKPKKVSEVVQETTTVLPEEVATQPESNLPVLKAPLVETTQPQGEAKPDYVEGDWFETPEQKMIETTKDSSMIDGEPPIVKEIENSVKPHVIENPTFRLTLGNALNKLRGFVATNVTIKSLLNNVIVNSADGKTGQSLGNYLTQGVRGISADVAKKVSSTFFPKESVDFTKKVKPEDLIGGVTPEGVEITQKNVGEFMKTFDDISHEKLGAGFIDAEVKDLNKMQKASFVYDLVKNMPDKVRELFTDAQIRVLQSIEAKEKELYNSLNKYLVDNGVIGKNDSSDGYIRFVMGQLGFDRLKRIAGEKASYVVTNGLSTHEFDNIIDAERFIKFSNKFNKEQPFDYDAATKNSLGKEKGGANLDIFRTHGAVNRMISYADMIGKLEADKFAGDTIAKAANGTNTHVNEYLGQAFKSGMHSNILPEILGVNTGEKGIVDKLGNVGTGLQMGANVISGLSQLMSTGVKTGLFGVANTKSVLSDVWKTYQKEGINKAVSALGVMKDQALKNLLASEGYNTSYEVMPMSTNTTGGRVKNFLMELGTANRWVESPAKSFIAQAIMRKVLKNNGYEPTDIVNNWNKFKQEKPNEYKMARDSILDWTNWISDVSSSARLQLGDKNVRSLLGKIKTYTIDQIDTSLRDLASAPDLALRAAFGDKPVDAYTKQHGIDGLKRLGASLAQQATWFVPTLISAYVALSDDSDTDEEKEVKRALAFEIAMEKTAKYGSPGVALDATALLSMLGTGFQGKNLLRSEQGLVGSIATSPVNATAGLAYLLLSLTAEKEHREIEAMRGLDKILKSFGGGRVAKAVATEAGITPEDTPNFSEKTGNLLEKSVLGKNTFIDRATGFNRNQVIENFLRNQIGKVNKEDKGFIEGIAGNISDYLANTSILRDWSALLEDMKDQDTKKVAYDSFLIAKNLPDKGYKTMKDALIGEGIVASDNPDIDKYAQLVNDAIIEQSQIGGGSVMGENLQDKIALGINTTYNPIKITGADSAMQAINGNLFKDNPRLYTQAVGLLAKLKNGYGRNDNTQQLSFEDIVKEWKGTPTNERIDAMVADATNTRALSDTITYALDGKIKEFNSSLDEMIAKGISPDAKGKESIMNTLKTFDTLYGVSESIGASPRAMPISAAETMRGIFEKMRVAGMTNELKEVGKNMKNLYNTVVQGLLLRGEVMPESTNNVQETGAGTGNLPISQVVKQATTSTTPTTQAGKITEPFTVPKWKNLKNEWKGAFPKQQAPSTTRTKEPKLKKMSLSEMLARSRQ